MVSRRYIGVLLKKNSHLLEAFTMSFTLSRPGAFGACRWFLREIEPPDRKAAEAEKSRRHASLKWRGIRGGGAGGEGTDVPLFPRQ